MFNNIANKKYVKVLSRETSVSVFRTNEWWGPHSKISGQSVHKIKSKKHYHLTTGGINIQGY